MVASGACAVNDGETMTVARNASIRDRLRFAFAACLLCVAFGCSADRPMAETKARIVVSGDRTIEHTPYLQGFLHGFESVDYDPSRIDFDAVKRLRPRFWRIGMTGKVMLNHRLAMRIDPAVRTTLVVSDQLAIDAGGYGALKPWMDWDRYERDVRALVTRYRDRGVRIDYWDVWSEPDTEAMWSGTCEQAMETFKRTANAIRAVEPNAKIVGPSVSGVDRRGACDEPFFARFLRYLQEENLAFDALSWHEFDDPTRLPAQAEAIHAFLRRHPALGTPELHVNEYSGPRDAPMPGWAIAWFAQLEAAGVDAANRACWGEGCSSGLNGLFAADNRTPTPLYWAHRWYAELPSQRLRAASSEPTVAVLAGKDDTKRTVSLLVGGFGAQVARKPAVNMEIRIERFPYAARAVRIDVAALSPPTFFRRMQKRPMDVMEIDAPVRDGIVVLNLPMPKDGDAYRVDVSAVR